MSKVLVLGATGFIGNMRPQYLPNLKIGLPIATAFARRGYTVYRLLWHKIPKLQCLELFQ